MTEYPDWYRRADVAFNLVKYTFNRECCFIMPGYIKHDYKATRMMRIHNTYHLRTWLKSMHVLDGGKTYNLYYSLARYDDGIPKGSLNLAERDFGDWNKNNWEQIVEYDLLIDVDAGNHNEIKFAYLSAQKIKKVFDEFEVPYFLRFSGMGFHFVIPFHYFKDIGMDFLFDSDIDNNIYDFYMKIAMKLHSLYSEMIDVSIYDSRRVIKIPYSIALYDGKEYLCRPFGSDDDFNGFVLKSMNPNHFIGRLWKIKDKLFNPEGNVFKLLKELKIKCQDKA